VDCRFTYTNDIIRKNCSLKCCKLLAGLDIVEWVVPHFGTSLPYGNCGACLVYIHFTVTLPNPTRFVAEFKFVEKI
jgi:hypothetical protein